MESSLPGRVRRWLQTHEQQRQTAYGPTLTSPSAPPLHAAPPAQSRRAARSAPALYLYRRAMTSLAQVSAMQRVSLPDLRGQIHLPT